MKVTIERDNCTSCGSCWELCPDLFEENPTDHFSQIAEALRLAGNIAQGEAPPDREDCVAEAADACPVQIILLG